MEISTQVVGITKPFTGTEDAFMPMETPMRAIIGMAKNVEMVLSGTKMAIHTVDAGEMTTEMATAPIPLKTALYTRGILKMATTMEMELSTIPTEKNLLAIGKTIEKMVTVNAFMLTGVCIRAIG